ncbi:adenylate/guanylate cyclase domain-containing protein [Dongia deserti]|uniref:adenylate/guanylate cyclase domain-containing protein n=1 Tax=Dongia deserti TaxID=2268030 RepID=UPI0013C4E9CF|nr:adenylate/guanylate cyclase domain-containing protein [Dongia deserti]
MAGEDAKAFEHWLAEGGLRNRPLSDLFNGFTQHLIEGGVPIARAYFGMSTRHPLIQAFDMTWEPDGALYHTQFDHGWRRRSAWTDSPLRHMIMEHLPRMRRLLQGPDAVVDFPVLQELAERGFTDWYGAVTGFEAESILETPGSLGMACSWSTERPEGFSVEDLALVNRLFPIFAVSIKASVLPIITRTLLGAYIGSDAAQRVWSGATNRGSIEHLEAAIFFSDLRGFTAFAEQASSELVMSTLNRYFDSVGAAITSEGGEILKFMGDGVLATFAQPDANVCEQALRAARAAVHNISSLEQAGAGVGGLDLGIALHKGEVLYGNVGTTERLDFTMIGPAVNEAARMEKLTKSLGCAILASDSFQAGLAESRGLLQPAGTHALSGLTAPRTLYRVVLDERRAA